MSDGDYGDDNGNKDYDNATDSNNETMNGILAMLKQAGVSTEDLEQKKHAFWDTQVRAEGHVFAPA